MNNVVLESLLEGVSFCDYVSGVYFRVQSVIRDENGHSTVILEPDTAKNKKTKGGV